MENLERPRSHSGLAVFIVFFLVFAFCAGVVVWLVTRPFTQVKSKSAQQIAAGETVVTPKRTGGEVLASFGSEGTGPGQFQDVRALAVDATGRIYAADFNRTGRIQVFDANGTFVTQWLASDRDAIPSLAVTRDGQVLVVQAGEITRFDGATGKRLGKVAYAQGFYDVAALPDGSLVAYGSFLGHDRIVYFDRTWRVTREVSDQVREQLRQTALEGHLTVDGSGRAWLLTGYADPSILEFSPEGKFTDRIPAGKPRERQFTGSASLGADNAGRLLVTGRDAVQVWTTGGQFLQSLPVEGAPRDIAVVDATTAWVSTGAQKIVKIRLPGQ